MSDWRRQLAMVSLALGAGLALGATWACTTTAGDDADAGPDDGAGDAGVDADAGVEDLARSLDCPTSSSWITDVSGRVVDEADAAVAGAFVQLCVRTNLDRLLCLRPTTAGDDGAFQADIAANARCMDRATARVVKPLTDTATLYCALPLPLSPDTSSIVLAAPYAVLSTTRAANLPPAGDAAVPRAVAFADDVSVDVVPAALPDGTYERLAARVLDDVGDAPACLSEGAPALQTLVAFSPEAEVDGAGFGARLPNRGGLAAGTSVPVYALGSIDCRRTDGTLVDEGQWEHFADGVVSADGSSVVVAGVPCLTWLGVGIP
jgi:hypothetical protein